MRLLPIGFGAALFVGCRPQAPNPTPPHPDAAASTSAKPGAPGALASSAPTRPEPPPLPEGCFAEARLDGGAEQLLQQVIRDCRLDPPRIPLEASEFDLTEGEQTELGLSFAAPNCARFVAAGAPTIEELELDLVDSASNPLGRDDLSGNLALLFRHGPICLKAGGYTLRVRALRGFGQVSLAGFSTGPAPNVGSE